MVKTPTTLEIVKTALYVGTVGYGGAAILAVMKKVIVHEKGWLKEDEFMNALSLAQLLPGAVGVTIWSYIGHRFKPAWGGIILPFAFAFPAMLSIILLAWAYFTFGDLPFVRSIFLGLGALVVALLINATLMLGTTVFRNMGNNAAYGIVIAALSFSGLHFFGLNVAFIILISGLLGVLFFYFKEDQVKSKRGQGALKVEKRIMKMRQRGGFLLVAFFIGLLAVSFWYLAGTWDIFAAFFKIGSLAFGGGFTAVPIIQHVVVDGMKWLDLKTFRDGIALGQITPGPVLITATFIGYKVQGIIGAIVATIGIFTPSLAAMILVSRAHAKIENLKIVKVFIKGIQAGFVGLLIAVVMQFGIQSLINIKTWTVLFVCIAYLVGWKKDAAWLVLGVIGLSLFLFP